MNIQDVRERGRRVGVKGAARMRKADLIRAIQAKEGNQACFGADWRFECRQFGCCWRQDCLTPNPG